jgi:hypothetical protein
MEKTIIEDSQLRKIFLGYLSTGVVKFALVDALGIVSLELRRDESLVQFRYRTSRLSS